MQLSILNGGKEFMEYPNMLVLNPVWSISLFYCCIIPYGGQGHDASLFNSL